MFNRLLEVELYETLFNVALKERHGKRWASARYDGRVRRRAGRLLAAGTGAWLERLRERDVLSVVGLCPSELVGDVPRGLNRSSFKRAWRNYTLRFALRTTPDRTATPGRSTPIFNLATRSTSQFVTRAYTVATEVIEILKKNLW